MTTTRQKTSGQSRVVYPSKTILQDEKNEGKRKKKTPKQTNKTWLYLHYPRGTGSMWNPEPQAPIQVPDTHPHPHAINHPECPSKTQHNVNVK